MEATFSPNIISHRQYEHDTANWASYIGAAGTTSLNYLFQTPAIARMASMSLPLPQLERLLSTVGVSQVKARFMLTGAAPDEFSFALALYAVDAHGNRVSAYYTTDAATAPPAPGSNVGLRDGEQIPNELAAGWLSSWPAVSEITAALFMSSRTPLLGYNFELNDLMAPLFAAQPLAGKALCLDFGLHTYYPAVEADEESSLTSTFGLLLRIANPTAPTGAARYYDMATPCPPNN